MTQKVWFVSPKGIDIFDSPAREAGVSIKTSTPAEMLGWGPRPEVERSGTPGTRSQRFNEPAERATAIAKNLPHNERLCRLG